MKVGQFRSQIEEKVGVGSQHTLITLVVLEGLEGHEGAGTCD